MDERERLEKLLEDTKEDAPISGKLFKMFIFNHFAHLHQRVSYNTKLLYLVLAAIIAAALAGSIF